MTCPFCRGQMRAGTMLADTRKRAGWYPDDAPLGKLDLFFGTYPRLTAAKHGFNYLRVKSDYCPRCKKMIFDTDIEN